MRQIGVGFVSSAKRTFDSIFFTKWKDSVAPSIDLLFHLKVPLSIAILSYVFFAVIEQTLEIYRNFAFDKNYAATFFSILFVFLLSVLVWHSARLLLLSLKCEEYDPEKPFFIWVPRILGICPLISLAYGFHKAAAEVKPAKEVLIFSSNLFLHSFSLFCLILAILLLLITIYRTKPRPV